MLQSDELKGLDLLQLGALCEELRARILEVVAKNGGHLSSSLGSVELIVALHHLFSPLNNPFIYDVSHQAYAHKLLTGRFDTFDSLRSFNGTSGFSHPRESEFDYFVAGHSSTSISLCVGVAKVNALRDTPERYPIAFIGDGAMGAGLAYEALNELGDKNYKMIIILNDNEMSISRPIGAISKHLSRALSSRAYQSMRDRVKKLLENFPEGASYMAKKFETSLKLITPGQLFSALDIDYIGPIDGHNLEEIIATLKIAAASSRPTIIHAKTIKGKGYALAEGAADVQAKWHGVGPFDLATGKSAPKAPAPKEPTKLFASYLLEKSKEDEKIMGITAAMPTGVGLDELIAEHPLRFFDVGIAEQHAVCHASSMAKEGAKVFVAIYSTFLQRAYDNLVHDVGILGIPLRFAIDRAGIVGEDGETHQGLFDVAYLRSIPNFVLLAPRDNESFIKVLDFALEFDSAPLAFRYPRKAFILDELKMEGKVLDSLPIEPYKLGCAQVLIDKGARVSILAYGNGMGKAYTLYKGLEADKCAANLVDLCFIKPFPDNIDKILENSSHIIVFADCYYKGGVASALMEYMAEKGIYGNGIRVKSFEVDDIYITHGSVKDINKSVLKHTKDDILGKSLEFLGR